MAQIRRLAMVILMVTDIEKAVAFYETLGAKVRCLFPKSWAELTLDDVTIAVCHTEEDQGQRRTGLVFAVDDLMSFYATHKEKLIFLAEPVTKLHGIMVSLQDPAGNILELYQATPEKVQEFMKSQKSDTCGPCGDEDKCCRS